MQRCAATSGIKSSTLPKAQKRKHVHQLFDPCLHGPRRCGRQHRCGMDCRYDRLQRANFLCNHRVARSGSPWNIRVGIDMTRGCFCRPLGCWTPTISSPYGGKCLGMSIHLCKYRTFFVNRMVSRRSDSLVNGTHNLADHSSSSDTVERAIFAYEKALGSAFNVTTGACRLDFRRIENRAFFLAIHRTIL